MTNKFILEITIYNNDKNELEIKFVHWDKRFLYEPTDLDNHPFCYYEAENGFSIFSNDTGYIFDDVLSVPSFSELKKSNIVKESFKTDKQRYNYLKKLHTCLDEWTNKYGRFKNDTMKNDNIIVNGKFWVK